MDQDSTPTAAELAELRAVLAAAAITISSFRWKLRDSAYPFREPPGVDVLIARIDALLYPDEVARLSRRRKSVPPPPPTPHAIAALEALEALRA